ncbi:MAG TPA: RDD family protein [Candidatus Obscuribacterales bacterium]
MVGAEKYNPFTGQGIPKYARSVARKQFCAGCGGQVSSSALSCGRCGRYFEAQHNASWRLYDSFYRIPALVDYRVGSPGKRIAAAMIDALILVLSIACVELLTFALFYSGQIASGLMTCGAIVSLIVIPLLYFSLFESSKYGATPGKLLNNLKVVDLSGRSITFGAAARRHATKWLLFWPAAVVAAIPAFIPAAQADRSLVTAIVVALPAVFYLLDVFLSRRNKDNRSLLDHWSGTLVGRRR